MGLSEKEKKLCNANIASKLIEDLKEWKDSKRVIIESIDNKNDIKEYHINGIIYDIKEDIKEDIIEISCNLVENGKISIEINIDNVKSYERVYIKTKKIIIKTNKNVITLII